MVNNQAVKSYYLLFQLNGIPEPVSYQVQQEDSARLQRVLQEPEKKHRFGSFFFFTATDGQKVIVSLRDIQLVTCGWDVDLVGVHEPAEDEDDLPVPKIEIYFRGTVQPYGAVLEDPGVLEAIFLANAFDFEAEPFVSFLDGEGEDVFFRPEHVVLLAYYWEEEKRNLSVVHSVKGRSPDDASISGVWRVQVWQSERDRAWYADLEFVAEGQEQVLEVETYGPCLSKTEAAEMAREGLETDWLTPPGSPVF